MSNSTVTSPIARELAPSVDAVGDWQRLYAADPSEANLRGLMRAVRVRRQWTAEEIQAVEAFDAQRRRRHFCEHVAEHVRGDPATTDDVRAANMEDLLVRYDELFPSRGVSLDDIVRRHEWRQFDPSTPKWRIAGMMRRSGVTLFSGDPKSGKTVFGRCLSVAVSGREQVFCESAPAQVPPGVGANRRHDVRRAQAAKVVAVLVHLRCLDDILLAERRLRRMLRNQALDRNPGP